MSGRIGQIFATVLVCTAFLVGCGGAGEGTTPTEAGTTTPDSAGKKGPDGGEVACGLPGDLCVVGAACKTGANCASTVCQMAKCVSASCDDKVQDGNETDVDCGGSCAGCATGKKCKVGADCASDVCTGDVCQAPTSSDMVKNDSETDVDCGGALLASGATNPASDGAPACATGKGCLIGSDCASQVCAAGPVLVDNLDGGTSSEGGAGKLVCQPATFHDGIQNDSETDVDCGGALSMGGAANPMSDGAPPCGANKKCVLASDCQSDVCTAGVCQAPTATDMVKNDSETDVDCGGGDLATGAKNPASDGAPACATGKTCILGTDCASLSCAGGAVLPDGGTDGGPVDCTAGQTCTCQAPTATDGVKNDSETDTDCGGAFLDDKGTVNPASDGAPSCQVNQACLLGSDCVTGVCNDNMGAGGPPADCPEGMSCTCQTATFTDGVQNGGETDVDCGGANALGSDGAPPCAPDKKCLAATDCTSLVCTPVSHLCAMPAPNDGVKNDSETDVDCGGVASPTSDGAKACPDSQGCLVDTDCLSGFCSLVSHTCVDGQSCKGLITPAAIMDISAQAATSIGGADALGVPNANGAGQSAGLDTCGSGEATDAPGIQQHESCCKSLPVPGLAIRMDKYEVTAGRVRQFVESVKQQLGTYNLQQWTMNQFNAALTPTTPAGTLLAGMIPTNQAGAPNIISLMATGDDSLTYLNVVAQLGGTTIDDNHPSGVQGCFTGPGADGAATYWWSSSEMANGVGAPPRPFTQDYYDIKPQNCAPYWIAAAFCAWDGGRLPTQAESNVVYGPSTYPWGASLYPNPYGLNTTILSRAEAADTTGIPISTYITGNPLVPGAPGYTINFWNGNLGASTGQGDFYFYPSWILNNPGTGPLAPDPIPDTLTDGLDLSPYIAAPGRFILDTTSVTSADGEGWKDYGANMLEYLSAPSLTGNIVSNYVDTTVMPNVVRAPAVSGVYWEGGSWEGHGIQRGGYNEPMQTQYGKAGWRCVRPLEP